MARAAGISTAGVQRLCYERHQAAPDSNLQAVERCSFRGKILGVIGLYLNPPGKALVLYCDEKSQCQALECSQPGLPLGIGHIKTTAHDCICHGTLTLFAALNDLEGKLITTIS